MGRVVRNILAVLLTLFGLWFCSFSFGPWGDAYMPWVIIAVGLLIAASGIFLMATRMPWRLRIPFSLLLAPLAILAVFPFGAIGLGPLGFFLVIGAGIAFAFRYSASRQPDREPNAPEGSEVEPDRL